VLVELSVVKRDTVDEDEDDAGDGEGSFTDVTMTWGTLYV
jgi:hypothetical protein